MPKISKTRTGKTFINYGGKKMSVTAQEVLNKAADIIERDGWHQGPTSNGLGTNCAVMAISKALGETKALDSVPSDSVAFYNETLALVRSRIEGGKVTVWNDTKGRTKEEVINALRGTQ